jgi:hypothetical protein
MRSGGWVPTSSGQYVVPARTPTGRSFPRGWAYWDHRRPQGPVDVNPSGTDSTSFEGAGRLIARPGCSPAFERDQANASHLTHGTVRLEPRSLLVHTSQCADRGSGSGNHDAS